MSNDLFAQAELPPTNPKHRPMRRVGVTGAAGKVGQCVVRELASYHYEVVAVDRCPPSRPLPAVFRQADLLKGGRTLPDALGDCDSVIHLAAPNVNGRTFTAQQLEESVRLTANVLGQAQRGGMSRVVLASSEAAIGYVHGPNPFFFDYLPVDEAHPLRPSDHYGVSKQMCEGLAEGIAHRTGIPIIALRPAWVLALDCLTRGEWARRFHSPPESHPFNFGSYVDARDTARAFRLALEAPLAGFQPFLIAAPDTRHQLPTLDLLRQFLRDDLPPGATCLEGRQSILSTKRAERLLGWRAARTWVDLPNGRLAGFLRRVRRKWGPGTRTRGEASVVWASRRGEHSV
jgi:nucleoside-diphosphate-sugar epimerase